MQNLASNRHLLLIIAYAAGLSACASGTGSTNANTPGSAAGVASPTVALSPSPAAVAKGQSATLAWNATNATSCTAAGAWNGTVPTSGLQPTPPLNATTKFTLICTGPGGSASQSATVTVGAATPTISISSDPSIVVSGGSTTLSWSASNATSCSASGAWSGSEPLSGTQSTGALSADATYTLSCTGPGGSASQSTTVTISGSGSLACSASSGPLTLKASAVRDSGISPFLVFFDATGTTDSSVSAKTTTFQDVSYSWNFGDSGASGTGTWAYGANPGKNSRNTATGGVAAHLYITPGVDTAYTVTVTARDGTNTASCQLGVSAYDPSRANGFAGTKTTCVSASATPTPGSGGCPAGAATLNTSSFNTALGSSHLGSGKRVLFKCGDRFTGTDQSLSGVQWSVGAFGGCEGTQANRPIFSSPNNSNAALLVDSASGDGRIADIDFEGGGSGNGAVGSVGTYTKVAYQITLSNLYSNGNSVSYWSSQGAQWAFIDSVMTGAKNIGVFVNYGANNPTEWSGNLFNNLDYQALIGNSFNGQGMPNGSAGIETLRISACRMCAIENNTVENSNDVGANMKIHNGNTSNSLSTWTGIYTELLEISDNRFGGTSGAQLVENAPQNSGDDERLRNIVVERNLFSTNTGAQGGRMILVSAVHETVRNNVFYSGINSSQSAFYGAQIARRGVEPVPSGVEVYNNICYQVQRCAGFDGQSFSAAAIDSFAQNNLFYNPASGHTTVTNNGAGNTVTNNTATPTNNPAFANGSGNLSVISDFKPTANYSGGTSVPVWYDALGVPWPSTWDLGALHP